MDKSGMSKSDKEFAIGASAFLFAAISGSISLKEGFNPVVFMCFGTSFGIIIGLIITGAMKGPKHEFSLKTMKPVEVKSREELLAERKRKFEEYKKQKKKRR